AYLNAVYQTGFTNPIDDAIRASQKFNLDGYEKLDEVPYDFVRKRLSVLVAQNGRHVMITKGAVRHVFDICSSAEPQVWNINFIRNFMIVFGVISSVFDFLTFGALVFLMKSGPEEFRTGWFVESVMTEVLIIVVMRTWQPFYKSRISGPLLIAMIVV